jgi:uncharacterized membrane protein
MRARVVFFILTLFISTAAGQHPHGNQTTQALELHPGLGNYHHPITTKSAEAQTYFNQGLTLLYGFNHNEAARYFQRAAELDPEGAMPYWGMALATGPNYNDTAVDDNRAKSNYGAVRNSLERAPKASPARSIAEGLATICCAVFFGAAAYISLVQHPAALETGSEFAVRFFAPMYRRASIMQASLALFGGIASLAAYFFGAGRAWLLSAVLIAGVVPFTVIVIEPLNDQIKEVDPSTDRAVDLLTQRGRLHWVRTIASGAAFVMSLIAIARKGKNHE